jgi:hypothetical protein
MPLLSRQNFAALLVGASCSVWMVPAAVVAAAPAVSRSVAAKCADLAAPSLLQLPRGRVSTPPPDLPRPDKGVAVRDSAFGACVIRATQHDAEPPKGFARNDYSRRQAFNADSSRILVIASDGAWHLYDARSLQHIQVLRDLGGDAEPHWHPTDPHRLYYLPRNGVGMKLWELDLRDGRPRLVGDLGPRLRSIWPTAEAAWTRSEGSPSADLRFWAFQVDNAAWEGVGMFVYDMQADSIIATYDFAKHGKSRPDHLSMSPSGRYVVVSWDGGPVVMDRDLTNPRKLAQHGEHSDIAVDAAGDDVYVSVDYQSRGGPVYMVNLRTGVRTNLFDTYVDGTATAMHFSGKAYARPGWVVVSTYADYVGKSRLKQFFASDGFKWLHRKVMAVELRASPAIINLAFHHSTYAEYWSEPQASTNPDLTRVLFNSNWGTSSKTDVDTYMIIMPQSISGLSN